MEYGPDTTNVQTAGRSSMLLTATLKDLDVNSNATYKANTQKTCLCTDKVYEPGIAAPRDRKRK